MRELLPREQGCFHSWGQWLRVRAGEAGKRSQRRWISFAWTNKSSETLMNLWTTALDLNLEMPWMKKAILLPKQFSWEQRQSLGLHSQRTLLFLPQGLRRFGRGQSSQSWVCSLSVSRTDTPHPWVQQTHSSTAGRLRPPGLPASSFARVAESWPCHQNV